MATNKIELSLKEAFKEAMISCGFVEDYDVEKITIEIPKEKTHGDYATNIAMQLTKLLRKNPRIKWLFRKNSDLKLILRDL